MNGKLVSVAIATIACVLPLRGHAQDVPGIEICTVEKTMERRTSCLQSNVDFLQKTITKLALDNQRRVDAANRQIEGLKAQVASLEKIVAAYATGDTKAFNKEVGSYLEMMQKRMPAEMS